MVPYKLKNWINIQNLDWSYLSNNINSIELLKKNPDKINWETLSANPNAIRASLCLHR